jgi:uncharacterized protein YbaP (TraB family)
VGRPDFYPLPAAVERAYQQAGSIALEIDPTDQRAVMDTLRLGTYEPPQTLQQNISPATYESLRTIASGTGVPLEALQSMKPFLAALTLTTLEYSRLGYDLQLGVDMQLASRAKRDGKKLLQLESARSQMEMMAGLSKPLQESLLEVTLRELSAGDMEGLLDKMITAWKAADTDSLERVLSAEEQQLPGNLAREFHDKFLTQRNVKMSDGIEAILGGREICLVAVGAGHLVGEGSLPSLLARRGYQVRRP